MATNGFLPKRLEDCPHPVCAACLYGKATKGPHKTKMEISINEYKPVVSVGDCVYVYVLVSSLPVLTKQRSGFLTHKRYQYACIFLNHHSDFTCVHLIKSQNVFGLVELKEYLEAYEEYHGVDIKHYHDYNGIFRSSQWINL